MSSEAAAPTEVRAERVSSNSAEVSWRPSPYGTVQGYRIYYTTRIEQAIANWDYQEIMGQDDRHTISGLDSFSDYAFRVQAKLDTNRLGYISEMAVLKQHNGGELKGREDVK